MRQQARWRQIAADLRALIEDGQLKPGDLLPSETEIAQWYTIQRSMVSMAMRELVAAGLVVRRPRLGTVVRNRTPVRVAWSVYQRVTDPDRDGADLGPWETACAALGLVGRSELQQVSVLPATADIATALHIEAGSSVVCRLRHLMLGVDVAQIARTYAPLALIEATPLAANDRIDGGAYAAFTRIGLVPTTATVHASARLPSTDERKTLNLGPGVAVLETWRATRDQDGQVIELMHSVGSAEAAILVFDDIPLRRTT
jgi:GntR family transcriptional regulator